MTEYKKTLAAVEGMEGFVKTMESASPAEERKAALDSFESLRSEWVAVMLKIKGRADEKDPEKQTYGETMVEKVKKLWTRWEGVMAGGEAVKGAVLEAWQPVAMAQDEAEEERERARLAELQRLRQLAAEEEARAQAAAAAKKKAEEEAEEERRLQHLQKVLEAVEHKARLEREREEDERERD
eukprot:Hpha_TRINITY_DN1908_c0_g1::TRINITY_DN1908_c0_g1_i1::g.31118::m.31118